MKVKLLFLSLGVALGMSAVDATAASDTGVRWSNARPASFIQLASTSDNSVGINVESNSVVLYAPPADLGDNWSPGATFKGNPFNDKDFVEWYNMVNSMGPIAIYIEYDKNGNGTVYSKWLD